MHENSSTNMLCFMLQIKYMNASVVFSNSCMTTAVMNTMNGYEIIKYYQVCCTNTTCFQFCEIYYLKCTYRKHITCLSTINKITK